MSIFDYEYTVRVSLPPRPDSDGPATVGLDVRSQYYRPIYQPTSNGILLPPVDEPLRSSSCSHFDFNFQPLSVFEDRLGTSLSSFKLVPLPTKLLNYILEDLTGFTDFVAKRTSPLPSLILVVEIKIVLKMFRDYDPPIPPLEAYADEISTREGRENEVMVAIAVMEDGVLNEERSNTFWENLFQITTLEYEVVDNGGTKMLRRIERGKSAMVGVGEVECSICLCELSEGEKVITMACQHSYHENCILAWFVLSYTCPLCRRPDTLD